MDGQSNGKVKRADATRAALIQAAERLIAKKGLADVSTREILQEAGQRNQSALQYHFGSKSGLIGATINERTKQIDRRRQDMLAAIDGEPTPRQLFEALIVPLGELMGDTAAGSNYVNFLSQAITQPTWDLPQTLHDYNVQGMLTVYEKIDAQLSHMDDKGRTARQNILFDFTILAFRRWSLEKEPKQPREELIKFVIEGCLALLKI